MADPGQVGDWIAQTEAKLLDLESVFKNNLMEGLYKMTSRVSNLEKRQSRIEAERLNEKFSNEGFFSRIRRRFSRSPRANQRKRSARSRKRHKR